MIDDKGLTTILTIILTVYNTVAHNFSDKSSSKEGLKYLNYFLFFIIYKSVGVYTNGINMQYLFGPRTPDTYKNFRNNRFKYLDKLLGLNLSHRNKLKKYLDGKNVFMFSDYISYLDWLLGAAQHLIMGKLLTKAFTSNNINKVKHLLILEVLYDFTNFFNGIVENNNIYEQKLSTKVGLLFTFIHFISVSSIFLLDDKNLELIINSEEFDITKFSELLLTSSGYIILSATILTYCLLYLEDNTRRDYLKNIVIYTILIIFYTNFILKFKFINDINKDKKISDNIKKKAPISIYGVYIYTFYPLILLLIHRIRN